MSRNESYIYPLGSAPFDAERFCFDSFQYVQHKLHISYLIDIHQSDPSINSVSLSFGVKTQQYDNHGI